MPFSHKDLVGIAYRWIMNNASVGFAFRELATINEEIPDVIGFGSFGHTVLIEVKASRSDFLSDKKKRFRQHPELGMGFQRFYLCPSEVIKKPDLPDGWGLIWVNEKGRARCVYSPFKGNIGERHKGFTKRNTMSEYGMMYSALRRLQLRGVLDMIYDKEY